MTYQVHENKIEKIADDLEQYYTDAWELGIKNVLTGSNNTIAGSFGDLASDSFINLKKRSTDSFTKLFVADLKLSLSVFCSNKGSLKTDFLNLGEMALKAAIDHIPTFGLSSQLKEGIALLAKKKREQYHEESIAEADKHLSKKSGEDVSILFNSDNRVQDSVKQSMVQYLALMKLIDSVPKTALSFEDALTLPKAAFKIQRAASSLNVALWDVQQYLSAMQERLVIIEDISKDHVKSVRGGRMKGAVRAIIQDAYKKGYAKGQNDLAVKKYHSIDKPKFEDSKKTGGASHLANYVAHATAQGYYDAGRDATRDTFARISKHW